jgi:PAS domain S-box-containing protein
MDPTSDADRAASSAQPAEAQLRASELQYRTLFVDSPVPMAVYDPASLRFLAVNAAAVALYGHSEAEFLQLSADSLREDPGSWHSDVFTQPVRGVRHYRARHKRKDGSLIHIEAVANDIMFEGLPARVVIYNDVTVQRESQRMLSALMGNLPGMAYRCRNDRDWTMEFASEGAFALTGYRPEMLVSGGVVYGEIVAAEDRDRVWREVQQGVERDVPFEMTYRITAANGTSKWVWERGCAVRGAGGQVTALEGFVSDVTELRRAQDEIARLNADLEDRVRQRTAQLQAANADLEAFAYSIAHDLRSPLTSIDGFSRSLDTLCADSLPEAGRHYLRRIRAGVRQMSDLTDAMLSLARLSRVELRWEPVDLAELARQAIAVVREQEPRGSVLLEIPHRMPAYGDPRLLAQVMANLVGNAWKFSAHAPSTEIRVGMQTDDRGQAVYFVADRGAGFDMAHASRLFGAFQRLHGPSEFEGTGIGLALVQKIVHRHGGRIWAEAQPGKGAAFYFTLGQHAATP